MEYWPIISTDGDLDRHCHFCFHSCSESEEGIKITLGALDSFSCCRFFSYSFLSKNCCQVWVKYEGSPLAGRVSKLTKIFLDFGSLLTSILIWVTWVTPIILIPCPVYCWHRQIQTVDKEISCTSNFHYQDCCPSTFAGFWDLLSHCPIVTISLIHAHQKDAYLVRGVWLCRLGLFIFTFAVLQSRTKEMSGDFCWTCHWTHLWDRKSVV